MPTDIRPLGAAERSFYWIKTSSMPGSGGYLTLVAIDEFGKVTRMPIQSKFDAAAMTQAEAVEAHLGRAIADADRELERRRLNRRSRSPPLHRWTWRRRGF